MSNCSTYRNICSHGECSIWILKQPRGINLVVPKYTTMNGSDRNSLMCLYKSHNLIFLGYISPNRQNKLSILKLTNLI